MKEMGINMGIRNPDCFSADKLQATIPKISISARKPIDTAWKILDFLVSFFSLIVLRQSSQKGFFYVSILLKFYSTVRPTVCVWCRS